MEQAHPGDGPFGSQSSSFIQTTEIFGGSGTASSTAGSDGDSNSDVVRTITTTDLLGQDMTLTSTYAAVTFTTITTTNLLGQRTTIAWPSSSSSPFSRTIDTSGYQPSSTDVFNPDSLSIPHRTLPTTYPTLFPSTSMSTDPTTTTSPPTTSSSFAFPTSTSSTTPPPAPSSEPSHGLSKGHIAAAVVLPILFLLFLALALLLLRRRRQRQSQRRAREASSIVGPSATAGGDVPLAAPPPTMRQPSHNYFTGHAIPAASLDATDRPARHPLENVRTGPAPADIRQSTNYSEPTSRDVSAVFTTSSGAVDPSATPVGGDESPYSTSIGSDPFQDPRLGSLSSSGPVSPLSPLTQTSPLDVPRAVSPPTRQPSAVSRRSAISDDGDGDGGSVISVGEAAVGDVSVVGGGRASVVQLRRGSGGQVLR